MQPIVLINPFKVSVEQETVFLAAWEKVDQYMKAQQGFLTTKLHRSLDVHPIGTYRFINVAHWESAEAFQAAISHEQFALVVRGVASFTGGAGLYQQFSQ